MRIRLNIWKVLGFSLDIPAAAAATQVTLGTMAIVLVGLVAYWLVG